MLSTAKYVSITADIATVLNSTRSFMVVSAHFIDTQERKLRSVALASVQLTENHTAINIEKCFDEVCREFDIDTLNIVSGTTDNAANIVSGMKTFLDASRSVRCYAHTLNLLVSDALDKTTDLKNILDGIKAIVTYFKHSSSAMDKLRKIQIDAGIKEGNVKTLIQNVDTRWNSTLDMLERFVLLSEYIATILSHADHSQGPQMLHARHIQVARQVVELLTPFKDATVEISGELYATSSLVLPLSHMLIANTAAFPLSQDSQQTTRVAEQLKKNLLEEAEKRLKPIEGNRLLFMATLIDPRFKRTYKFSSIHESHAIQSLANMIREEKRRLGAVSPPRALTDKPDQPDGRPSLWALHEQRMQQAASSEQSSDAEAAMPEELSVHFKTPCTNRETTDPIDYWLSVGVMNQAMANVALKLLTVMGSSVPSERIVSTLNLVVQDNRSRTTSEHIKQRVFLCSLDKDYWDIKVKL